MEESCLYHYTSIENLSLILKYKTFRFKPLNTLDDLLEGICRDGFELRKCVFVSCWTEIERESIPFWNMYTPNMSGVRIRMPKKMFTDRSVVIDHPRVQASVQFSILGEETLNKVRETKDKFSVEEIEDKLSAIAFKQGISFSLISESASDGVVVPTPQRNTEQLPAWLQAVENKLK